MDKHSLSGKKQEVVMCICKLVKKDIEIMLSLNVVSRQPICNDAIDPISCLISLTSI